MTRAARLKQGILVTLVLPVSNVQVSQVPLHDTLVGFATLPLRKGPKGFARGKACLMVRGIEVFHSIRMMLCKPHKVVAERSQKSYWYEEVRPKV